MWSPKMDGTPSQPGSGLPGYRQCRRTRPRILRSLQECQQQQPAVGAVGVPRYRLLRVRSGCCLLLCSVSYHPRIQSFIFLTLPSIPEITDADVAAQSEKTESSTGYVDKPFRRQYTLFWGVAAQFCYVGAQVAVAGFFIHYVTEVKPSLTTADGSNLLAVAQALFAVGRFVASLMMKWIKPRYILLGFLTGCVIFIAAAIPTDGDAAIAMLCMVLFFESCIFPTIFTLSLRGLGRHTKRGASFLVASVSGGAVFPPMLGAVVDARNTRIAMAVPLGGFLIAYSFPIYLNLFKAKELDAFNESKVGVETGPTDKAVETELFEEKNGGVGRVEKV